MVVDPWFTMMLDRRGSLFLPVPVKKYLGMQPGDGVTARLLGPAIVLVPFQLAASWPQEPRQREIALSKTLNDGWEGKAPAVAPPLFGAAAGLAVAAPQEPVFEEDETTAPKQEMKHLIYVNQKGFLTFPQEVKDLFGLNIGMPIMIEVRMKGHNPVLVIEPVTKAGTINDHLEKKKQEHLNDEKLRQTRDALRAEVEALRAEKKELEMELGQKRAAVQGKSFFAQMLENNSHRGESAPRSGGHQLGLDGKPIDGWTAAKETLAQQEQVPPHMDPTKIPKEPCQEGNKWHFSEYGWVQVANVED